MKEIWRGFLFLFLLLILVVGIGLFCLNNYLQSNTTKVIDQLPFLDRGLIAFDQAELSVWQNFPSVSINLHQVQLKDSSQQARQPIQLTKITATASLAELLNKSVDIQQVHLEGGTIQLYTDSLGNSNLQHLFKQGEKPPITSTPKEEKFQVKFDQLQVSLTDIALHITNEAKDQSIHGTIHSLTTYLQLEDANKLSAQIALDVAMQELALKKKNGGFVENSLLKGRLEVQMQDDNISIPPFDLQINEETFQCDAYLYLNGTQTSVLNFKNQEATFDKVLPLLPHTIQKALRTYQIERPFFAAANIQTNFKPGASPLITVDFQLEDNDVEAFGITLDNTSLNGQFINRLYDDERQQTEAKGNIRVLLHDLKGSHNSFLLESDSITIQSTKAGGPHLQSTLQINGLTKDMGEWLGNNQFHFEKGDFHLQAHINGALKDVNDIIVKSDAQLSLTDFSVFYEPAHVAFPFKQLDLDKRVGDAYFTIINNTFGKNRFINIDGGLKNLPALLVELAEEQANSEIHIEASKLSWSDFLNLFASNGFTKKEKTKTEKEKKKSMKATLLGIQHNFQPRLTIAIDTLQYLDKIQLLDFHTGVHFEDEYTLVLEKTHFLFDGSPIDLSAKLDIRKEQQTPVEFELLASKINLQQLLPKFNYFNVELLSEIEEHPEDVTLSVKHATIIDDHKGPIPNTGSGHISIISNKNKKGKFEATYASNYQEGMPLDSIKSNTQIYIEGEPSNFNDFFKTEDFFFTKGKFNVNFDYQGDFYSIQNLLEQSKTTFSLTDSKVFYKPANVAFPLTKIEVTTHDNDADFNFLLQSDSLNRAITFNGKLDNISELIIGNTGHPFHADIKVYSPKLVASELMSLFPTDTTAKKQDFKAFKKTLLGMLHTFDPTLQVQVDTFTYKKVQIKNVVTGVHLQDSTTVVLDKTGFDFHTGNLNFNGQVTLHEESPMPFELALHTNNFDLGGLLEELDYLEVPVLKDMEELHGRLTMDLDLHGAFTADGKQLIETANEGVLFFNLEDLEIKGLPPLDTIAAKLHMTKRFEDVQFASITDTIYFKQTNIEIPLMEIQSNALHLFVEGNFGKGDATNLWISVPLDNLKITNRSVIPEKLGYATAKHKVYLEATSTKEGTIHLKFHPTKKKYYTDRGILEQYKADKKRDRVIRKARRAGILPK